LNSLRDNLGAIVCHEKLIHLLGREVDDKGLQLVREHVSRINKKLIANKMPYAVAVTKQIGYALCKIASSKKSSI
jgi:DNA-binding response OmpR family regulator